ncbi:MAG TPA: hypothetical protein VGA08_02365 [Candidatus Saccharimonadales bacterium]
MLPEFLTRNPEQMRFSYDNRRVIDRPEKIAAEDLEQSIDRQLNYLEAKLAEGVAILYGQPVKGEIVRTEQSIGRLITSNDLGPYLSGATEGKNLSSKKKLRARRAAEGDLTDKVGGYYQQVMTDFEDLYTAEMRRQQILDKRGVDLVDWHGLKPVLDRTAGTFCGYLFEQAGEGLKSNQIQIKWDSVKDKEVVELSETDKLFIEKLLGAAIKNTENRKKFWKEQMNGFPGVLVALRRGSQAADPEQRAAADFVDSAY